MTPSPSALLYDGLTDGWLHPEDLDADLVAVHFSVRLAEPCRLHPDGGCPDLAVHRFDPAGARIHATCHPDGPAPQTTTEVVAVRFEWGDGRAADMSPGEVAAHLGPFAASAHHAGRP